MKAIKSLVAVIALVAFTTSVSFAGESCCDKAKSAGKTCTHKCCEKATKEGKTCEKCNAKKENKESK